MFRLLVLVSAFLMLVAAPAFAQERQHLPDINPMTGKPFGPKAIAEYEAEMARSEQEEEAARKVSAESEKRWEEARARNAAQIKKFDDDVEAWRKANPPPPGTKESLVGTSYDDETALPEGATVTYFNGWDVPTHRVEFGPDGKPTGPVTQTQQGKAWETIGPHIPPDGGPAVSYDRDFEGREIISYVRIFDKHGWVIARYDFNFDGVAWRGETFDPETGRRTGGFQDDRLKPPKATLGGPLDVPPTARAVTGICEPCRPLADQLNDVAARMNIIISEMASLSDEHQHAWPPAQKPIEMRYAALAKQLAELTPQYEALLAKVKACGCPKADAGPPPALTDGPAPPAGPPKLPPPPLNRPQFERVEFTVPPSFCSEEERVAFMDKAYAPAAAAALANAATAQAHQAELIDIFVRYRDAKSEYLPAIEAERDAYAKIAEAAVANSTALNARYDQLLAVPIRPCGQSETPPPPAVAVPSPTPAPVTPKDRCPPRKADRPGRKSIVVGPNAKVGSGARTREKVAGTVGGMLLGAAGLGGGGSGGSDGPQLVSCRIKDSEMTVFDDPETGTSLRVGAKRSKDAVVVFAEVAKSRDSGTFQTAFLENPAGDVLTPSDAGICGLWGEWKLTVSWTKTTYVDGQVVDRQSGGWSKSGAFSIPGVLSKGDAPSGMWKQLGFSNASHGARKVALQFRLPASQTASGPMTLVIHVTQPGLNPVTTVPFVLAMRERNGVFTFEDVEGQEARQPEDCPTAPATRIGDSPPPEPPPAPPPPPLDAKLEDRPL